MNRLLRFLPCLLLFLALTPAAAFAQGAAAAGQSAAGGLTIDFNGSGLFTDRMVQIIALVTVLYALWFPLVWRHKSNVQIPFDGFPSIAETFDGLLALF